MIWQPYVLWTTLTLLAVPLSAGAQTPQVMIPFPTKDATISGIVQITGTSSGLTNGRVSVSIDGGAFMLATNLSPWFISSTEGRASWQHKHIDNAIAAVVAARFGTEPLVLAGYSPEVRTCADYADTLGHLTADGAVAAAQAIGDHYIEVDASGGQLQILGLTP